MRKEEQEQTTTIRDRDIKKLISHLEQVTGKRIPPALNPTRIFLKNESRTENELYENESRTEAELLWRAQASHPKKERISQRERVTWKQNPALRMNYFDSHTNLIKQRTENGLHENESRNKNELLWIIQEY